MTPPLTFDAIYSGPLVDITIGPVSMPTIGGFIYGSGPNLPTARPAKGMLNTGNYPTVVSDRLLEDFVPLQDQWHSLYTPFDQRSDTRQCPIYHVEIAIQGTRCGTFYVLSAPLGNYKCDCLLGRYFLQQVHFQYDGFNSQIMFDRVCGG